MKQQLRKQQFKSLLLAVLAFMPLAASAQVEINETNFPDEDFRNYLLGQDYGKDGVLTEDEIKGVAYFGLDLSNRNISSFKGIEYFTALTELFYTNGSVTELDLSNNTALFYLNCTNNQLTTLDLSKNTALEYLSCGGNQLTSLDISNCTKLKSLYCGDNQLPSLDLSGFALLELSCPNNQLTSLNVSGCTALTSLTCAGNQLTSLDVSDCPLSGELDVSRNNLKGAAMDAFISSLPVRKSEYYVRLMIYDNTLEDEGNVCTPSQVEAALAKMWSPQYRLPEGGWNDYHGSDESTGIMLPDIEVESANTPIYDLSGKRVNNLQGKKGVYIVGGKKVLVK